MRIFIPQEHSIRESAGLVTPGLPANTGSANRAESQTRPGTGRSQTWLTIGPIGFVFCVANAIIFAATIAEYLRGEQAYTDLISGSLAWTNADKGFDFRVFDVFLAMFGLLLLLVRSLSRRLPNNKEMKATLEGSLLFSLCPGALWLGGQLVTDSFGHLPSECLLLGAVVLLLFFVLSRPRLRLSAGDMTAAANTTFLALMCAFFGGLGLATFQSRALQVEPAVSTAMIAGVTCCLTLLAIVAMLLVSVTSEQIENRLGYVVFGSQLLLPLLWAILIPPSVVNNGQRVPFHASTDLWVIIAIAAALSWAALIRRWITRRSTTAQTSNGRFVALTIVPIAVFLAVNHTTCPTFFGDDFHTGEHLLPWQQFWIFGKLPFVGFVPVHPLMDFFVGGVNTLFFDGTLASFENSRAILFALAAAISFLSIERFAGLGLACLLMFAANLWDRLLIVPVLFVILCHPALLRNKQPWLLCWLALCPIALCYNPAIGVALTLAFVPFAALQASWLFVEERKALGQVALVAAVAFAAVMLDPTAHAVFVGLLRFLIDNGRTVLLVHGIEWQPAAASMPSTKGLLATPLLWELLRFSWIIVLVAGGWLFVNRFRHWRYRQMQALVFSGLVSLFLFFLASWTLTRIDPSMPSRPAEVSYLACLYLLPLLLFAIGSWRATLFPLFALLIGFFQGGMADFPNSGSKPHARLTTSSLLQKPTAVLTVPPGYVAIDGRAVGLPNLGRIYARENIFNSVARLRSAISALLRPGETYLDLTNRQAYYFYLGLPVAVSYGAPWLTASTLLQDQTLREIEQHPEPVVWLAPALALDPEAPILRDYKLCRFLLQRYLPFVSNNDVFLVLPERLPGRSLEHRERIALLKSVFGNLNLGRIPSAWGGSWRLLQSHFTPVLKLTETGGVAPVVTHQSMQPTTHFISGKACDFLRFDLVVDSDSENEGSVSISWTSEYRPGNTRFTAAPGTNLVPLGAFPDWLLSDEIHDLAIHIEGLSKDSKYRVTNAELLRLND